MPRVQEINHIQLRYLESLPQTEEVQLQVAQMKALIERRKQVNIRNRRTNRDFWAEQKKVVDAYKLRMLNEAEDRRLMQYKKFRDNLFHLWVEFCKGDKFRDHGSETQLSTALRQLLN